MMRLGRKVYRSPWDDTFWMAHPRGVQKVEDNDWTLLGFLICAVAGFALGFMVGYIAGTWG